MKIQKTSVIYGIKYVYIFIKSFFLVHIKKFNNIIKIYLKQFFKL
jgi:hypothetical protein